MSGLEGYATLITGGGSGIGLGCAVRFAADGAHVTICGRSAERLEQAAETIREKAADGVEVQWIPTDVTDEEQVIAAIELAATPTGLVDGVVASAGGGHGLYPLTQIPLESWQQTIDLNLTGTFLCIKHWARLMAPHGRGSFVGMSSIAGQQTHRWFGPYGPAKAGIEALCDTAADELGASGLRFNSIRPGLTDTDLISFVTAGGPVLDSYLAQTPLARYATVDDIAGLARYLLGPDSAFVTRQNIAVDGGISLRGGPDYSGMLEGLYGAEALRGIVE